jgi:serine-type D-Ala-D-Ala endopeptidase (penicillin-binding protein 7)
MRLQRLMIWVLTASMILGAGAALGKTPSRRKPSKSTSYRRAAVTNAEGKRSAKVTLPRINARSVLVIDNSKDQWLYSKDPKEVQSIASLTKLLTAMAFLDGNPNLDTVVYINSRHCFESSSSRLREGESYRAMDLLHAALMSSDNRAARALVNASGCTEDVFIDRMNAKAQSLGMQDTRIYEVTGLDERNVSTSADIATLVREAMKYPLIQNITSTYTYRCLPQNKKRFKNFTNTNRLIKSQWQVVTGKTGYILQSEYCLATILRDNMGKEITVVVLGAPTNDRRFSVARKLAQYGFQQAGKKEYGARQVSG